MKITIFTDTHFGHSENTHKILEKFYKKTNDSERPDLIIHSGDWTSHNQDQFQSALKQIRRCIPETRIIGIDGNHDFWNGKIVKSFDMYNGDRGITSLRKIETSYDELVNLHKKIYKENDIDYLEDIDYLNINNIIFIGFNGWYNSAVPRVTNDSSWIDKRVMLKLWNKSREKISNVLSTVEKFNPNEFKRVCITHFQPFTENYAYIEHCADPSLRKLLTERFDYLILGHSHQRCDFIENDCRVLNTGSGYNNPKFVSIEI